MITSGRISPSKEVVFKLEPECEEGICHGEIRDKIGIEGLKAGIGTPNL